MKSKTLSAEERERLEATLGYAFSEKQWLDRALTHASTGLAKGANYERLEFLGDRVLGLCVAELLFTTFRNAPEGELSVRLNQLVSAESCASVADELELHRFIRTRRREETDRQADDECPRRCGRKPDRSALPRWRP